MVPVPATFHHSPATSNLFKNPKNALVDTGDFVKRVGGGGGGRVQKPALRKKALSKKH